VLLSPLSGLEFVYAQTPYSMRGTMIGMFFLTRGLFSTLAAILLFIFSVGDVTAMLLHTTILKRLIVSLIGLFLRS